ncbi:hypothetical protein [Spiroplasma endosymbiont of Ammophila pubescens]|uniref:hypothetical protein n=1 Tax=Spiroplasma endosymbiont of Ammophila pubescens TaxID=3066315 RepID=UPI0032B2CACE
MLFGNIKCWGNINGVYSYPSSIVENASLVPLLSMPIETNPNVIIFHYWFTKSFLSWSIAKNYIQGKDILDLINKNGLDKVLLNYLTYRYNYDRKFQGAKYDEKGNPTNKSAILRQKFEGQKPEDVIDGLFENWKLDNYKSLNDNAVKRFKQIIYLLSTISLNGFSRGAIHCKIPSFVFILFFSFKFANSFSLYCGGLQATKLVVLVPIKVIVPKRLNIFFIIILFFIILPFLIFYK